MSGTACQVAITGIGLVTPLGSDLAAFTRALLAGRSAAGPITVFDPASLPTRIAAEVDMAALPFRSRDRKVAFARSAAAAALADAEAFGRALGASYPPGAGGLSVGLGLELFGLPDMIRLLADEAIPAGEDPMTFLQIPADLCVGAICARHDLRAPPLTHISACAASTDALGAGAWQVRDRERAFVLAGGADSMLNPMGLGGFCKIEATSRRNAAPAKASRPFDRGRDGFLLGEGAGMMVLEPLEAARARGARVYGTLDGYGSSFDASGISDPHPEGEGATLAMARALRDAGVGPDAIDLVSAHGTSTPKNDPIETLAIKRALGERARAVPVVATKSMLGHLISASGVVELAAALLAAREGFVHPTLNLEKPDPACDLDYVPEGARRHRVRRLLKNSFGFGGQNACLVVGVGGGGADG